MSNTAKSITKRNFVKKNLTASELEIQRLLTSQIKECRLTFGIREAQELWRQSDLPLTESMLLPKQLELPLVEGASNDNGCITIS